MRQTLQGEAVRRQAIRDANEPEIVDALERVGATVARLSGKGLPDLLVGFRGVNYAIEVKDGSKVPSDRRLTPDQVEWHRTWRGQVDIANSIAEAFKAIGVEVK